MEYLLIIALVAGGLIWLMGSGKKSSKSPPESPRESQEPAGDDTIRIEISMSADTNARRGATTRDLTSDFNSFWHPARHTITVQGYSIDGGLLYVGQNLAAAEGYLIEPALIDPNLKVDEERPARDGTGMDYWPSYEKIAPNCRAAFLEWLAQGRKDPNAYIGYVFLYFYGLERRLLHDHRNRAADQEERREIFNEVKRLLKLYGDNRSFAHYAQNFLYAIYLGQGERDLTQSTPLKTHAGNDFPAPVKVGLGQFSKAGKPIPADWALVWVLHDPDIRLRTPARRCHSEFETVFQQLYRDQHGDGIVVKPNKTPVRELYHPASSGIRRQVEIYDGPTLPDITILKRPRTLLTDIAEQATDKLDAYSRFIGKDGVGRDSLQGVALLPEELNGQIDHPGLEALRATVEHYVNDRDWAFIPTSGLLEHFPVQKPDRLSKKECVLLAQLLEKIGFGMEPDVRFSGLKPGLDEQLAVFRRDPDAPTAPSPAFEAAALVMRLAAMVSAADGEVSAAEEQQLEQHIEASLALEAGERRRLHAHKEWQLRHDRGMAGLKAQIEELSSSQRETIGEYLVTIAAADGHIDPGEVKILQKLYKQLGLDPERVVSDVHGASAGPVTVKPATPREGYSIPDQPSQPSDEPEQTATEGGRAPLDPDALQRKLAETTQVSTLLHGILGEEVAEEESEADSQESGWQVPTIDGLDAEHSALLREVGESDTWERAALEHLADRQGLMLEGALETINEAAFDHCDAPCIEEDGDVYVLDREVYKEMIQ